MTGEGTTTNPYIPESWADFKTAIGTENVYVEVPTGTVYDLDKLEPTGISQITFAASSVNGNGLIIKNGLYTTRLINHDSKNTVTIDKIHFANFEIITSAEGWIFDQNSAMSSKSTAANINDCSFVGTCSDGRSPFESYQNGGYLNLNRCYFEWVNNCQTNHYWVKDKVPTQYNNMSFNFRECNFKITDLKLRDARSWCRLYAENCFFAGDASSFPLHSSSAYVISIMDAEHKGGGTLCLTTSNNKSDNWITVTDDQLQDRDYLKSIKFPII